MFVATKKKVDTADGVSLYYETYYIDAPSEGVARPTFFWCMAWAGIWMGGHLCGIYCWRKVFRVWRLICGGMEYLVIRGVGRVTRANWQLNP